MILKTTNLDEKDYQALEAESLLLVQSNSLEKRIIGLKKFANEKILLTVLAGLTDYDEEKLLFRLVVEHPNTTTNVLRAAFAFGPEWKIENCFFANRFSVLADQSLLQLAILNHAPYLRYLAAQHLKASTCTLLVAACDRNQSVRHAALTNPRMTAAAKALAYSYTGTPLNYSEWYLKCDHTK